MSLLLELQNKVDEVLRVTRKKAIAAGVTVHLEPTAWREVFADAKAMATKDVIEVSHHDYQFNIQRFKFRGVIYEAVEPETTMVVVQKDFLL